MMKYLATGMLVAALWVIARFLLAVFEYMSIDAEPGIMWTGGLVSGMIVYASHWETGETKGDNG